MIIRKHIQTASELFDELWEEWLNTKLYLVGKGAPLLDKGYEGVFESLSEEEQAALIGRKRDFQSVDEFKLELERYIDYYNNKRIKGKLKGPSPAQYGLQSSLVA